MKCSSRRNCNQDTYREDDGVDRGLNEVQLPKELQRPLPEARCPLNTSHNEEDFLGEHLGGRRILKRITSGPNEVQLPKELQRPEPGRCLEGCRPQ